MKNYLAVFFLLCSCAVLFGGKRVIGTYDGFACKNEKFYASIYCGAHDASVNLSTKDLAAAGFNVAISLFDNGEAYLQYVDPNSKTNPQVCKVSTLIKMAQEYEKKESN